MKHLLLLFPLCLAHLANTIDSASSSPPPVLAPKPEAATPRPPCPECLLHSQTPTTWRATGPEISMHNDAPERLPVPEEVTPLPLNSQGTPAADPRPEDPAITALVEKYLRDLSPEEQRVWKEELQGLPTEVVKELLTAKERSSDTLHFDPAKIFAPSVAPAMPPPQSEPYTHTIPPSVRMHAPEAATDPTHDLLREAEILIRHNIANANTIAYKRILPLTEGASDTAGLIGLTPRRAQSQGEFRETGRPLDCALDGPGFFQIEREGHRAITRRGILEINEAGHLIMQIAQHQWRVHPPIEVPQDAPTLRLDEAGHLFAIYPSENPKSKAPPQVLLGQLELVRPHDWEHWEMISEGVWAIPTPAPPLAPGLPCQDGFSKIRPGGLEGSNVNLEAELDDLRRLRSQIEALAPHPGGSPTDEHWAEGPQPTQQSGFTHQGSRPPAPAGPPQ